MSPVDRFLTFARASVRIALLLSSVSLLTAAAILIVYGNHALNFNNEDFSSLWVAGTIIISYWTIVYALLVLSIIFIYNYFRKVPALSFIRKELITLCITIVSALLFVLTVVLMQ